MRHRRAALTSNPEPIVPPVQHEFQSRLADITGPDTRSATAYQVELTRFRRLLALGAVLLRLFCGTRAAVRPAEPVTAPDGTRLPPHDQRPTTDSSVFGKVRFARHFFTAPGQEGRCPLDAELSLPARCDADLLREWAVYGTTDESYRESQTVLERILGLSLSLQTLETGVAAAGDDVAAFYEQPVKPPPASTGETPSWWSRPTAQGGRWGSPPPRRPLCAWPRDRSGPRRRKRSSPGLSTIAPSPRTPQEVVAALLQDPNRSESAARPVPVGQELRATLAGKAVALSCLAQRVAHHEGPHIQPRVARTDGAKALPQHVVTHFPAYPLVLDILHATAYLWDTATALLGETHPHRLAWVGAYLEPLVAGQTDAVMTALEAEVKDPTHTATQRQAIRRTVGDDRRNRLYMHDDEYLARGWPMGTGVVEGACGHLVNDRMEQSGLRWTKGGAQAVLDRRAVRLNGHGDTSGLFHRHQPHQRLYGRSVPAPALAEARGLEWAA